MAVIKNNKTVVDEEQLWTPKSIGINFLISLVVCAVCGLMLLGVYGKTAKMSVKLDDVKSANYRYQNKIKLLERRLVPKRVILQESILGVSRDTVESDSRLAKNYFNDAFTWTSGDMYDKARAAYIEKLGENNPFVTHYMVENTRIEVADPSIVNNNIDVNGLKSKLDDIVLYPVAWSADQSVDYIAKVEYIPYKKKRDLKFEPDLKRGKAFVIFKVRLNDKGEREVVDVDAYAGTFG